MRGDSVQEPTIMGNNHGAARKLQQSFFQSTESFNVQVIGRFVKKKNIAAVQEGLGHMKTSAFTTGQITNDLLLISALEVESADIRTARHFELTYLENIQTVRDCFPNSLIVRERLSCLSDGANLNCRTNINLTRIRLLVSGNQLE